MDMSFYDVWEPGPMSTVFTTSVVFAILCPAIVIARIAGRYIYDLRLGLDDALIVPTMVYILDLLSLAELCFLFLGFKDLSCLEI